MARSKSSLLIDSPVMCMQSTEMTFAGNVAYMDTMNWLATQLISIVNPSIFHITVRTLVP